MSATDTSAHYFFEAKPRATAKVGSGGVASTGATTIPHTFSGLDSGDAYIVTINRTDSTGTTKNAASETETFIGKVSGTNFINCVREVEGTAQAWAADTVLEILNTATGWNKMIEGLEVNHDQTGSHKTLTDSNGNEWIEQGETASAVNQVKISNAATGNAPKVEATGGDTNIDLDITPKGTGKTNITANDLNLATGANVQVNDTDPKRTIVLPAPAFKPTTTSGCATVATIEAGTNDIDYQVLDFDASSDERAFINFTMPDSWDGGTITAKFVWTAASSSGDVIWGLQGRAYANDDAIDQALGTAQTVTDTLTATGDICITSATSAITLAGSPAGGQMVHLRVYRDADAGGDTLAADARLIAVHIEYSQATYTD